MTRRQRYDLSRIILALLISFVIVLFCQNFSLPSFVKAVLFLIPYLISGYDVLLRAAQGIVRKEFFDENFLMAMATVGAFFLGEFSESLAVMIFYQTGELFQSLAVGRSRKSIAGLMDIRPDFARVLQEGKEVCTEPQKVPIGSIIAIFPGERVPLDGTVIEGDTDLDVSALTGESIPKEVKTGDEIFGGSVNLTGKIKIRTSKKYEESTVARILDLVENSMARKSRSEKFITKFARFYTPLVFFGALALALLPPFFLFLFGQEVQWLDWVMRALTFLVISCPCALVISVPLTFFGGIGAASRKGILVKGGRDIENLASVKKIAFDKTGTLTSGFFEVAQIETNGAWSPHELLEVAALAESSSLHPIAKSICRTFGEKIDTSRISHLQEHAGFGVFAMIDGKEILVGNSRMMAQHHIEGVFTSSNRTTAFVACNRQYIGKIYLEDRVKSNVRRAISDLRKIGIADVMILTGDTKEKAHRIAEEAGVEHVCADLLPADKVRAFEGFMDKDAKTAFVGDGINDAPTLARADVGIAMGALGSDAAIESADVVVMDDDIYKLVTAKRIAQKTMRIVRQNISLALTVKGGCLVLGALGFTNMWLAVFADVGVMILAILNAMRCLSFSDTGVKKVDLQ